VSRRPIFEVVDPNGRRVRLDEETVTHITGSHPEMEPYMADVVEAISSPDVIERDPWPRRERYFRRGVGPSMWLRVVVDFDEKPPRVVTAFGLRKGPAGAVE
jgi:hypothetical protein